MQAKTTKTWIERVVEAHEARGAVRDRRVVVMFTEAEALKLFQDAKASGLSVGELVRHALRSVGAFDV